MSDTSEEAAIIAGALQGRTADQMFTNKVMKAKFWFYITRYVKPRDPQVSAAHLAYQVKLEREGILFAAGPVSDPDGGHEFGLIVIRAQNAEQARTIADADPMHATGTREYTLHQWMMNEGHIGFGIDLHDGRVTFR